MKKDLNDVKKLLPLLSREGMERFFDVWKLLKETLEELNQVSNIPTQQPAEPPKQARPVGWSNDVAKIKRFRNVVVRKIWEPDLRAELVDRIVDLTVNGFVRPSEVNKIIDKATHRKRLYDETNGAKGTESIWRTIGAWVKQRWQESGRTWTATNKRLEPQPPEQKSVVDAIEERWEQERDYDGNVVNRRRTEISKENQELLKQALNLNKTDSIL